MRVMSWTSSAAVLARWPAPLSPTRDEIYSNDATSGIYPVVQRPQAPNEQGSAPRFGADKEQQRGASEPTQDSTSKERPATSDALNDVYRECAPAIYRMMLRLGIPERYAEDATNDVFVTALPRWNEFRGDSTRRTWLFGFAVKVAANQRRKLSRAGEESALAATHDFEATPDQDHDPFEQASNRQALEQLESLLDTLSLEERALWLLVHYEELSVSDAAAAIGMSAPKAYVLVKWVHAKLVKAWKRNNPPDAWRTR